MNDNTLIGALRRMEYAKEGFVPQVLEHCFQQLLMKICKSIDIEEK